jgi:S-layer protein
LSGGATQTVTASNSAQVSGTTGAIKVTATTPTTSLDAVDYTGWAAGAGVFVRNGSTVSVTSNAGTFTTTGTATASAGNSKAIQVGSDPSAASGATDSTVTNATATGYPTLIGNLADAPTGDVTTSVKTTFTDDYGSANVTYGTGATKIYMNGGSTASVTGAGAVTIRDLQTVATKTSSTATAAPAKASTLTTVNLTGVSGAAGIHSDALTSVSVVDSSTTVTVNSNVGKNATALQVSVGNSTTTVSASEATSVAVTGVQSANAKIGTKDVAATNSASTLTLTTPKATSLSINGTSDISLSAASSLPLVTAISASGSGALTLGTVTDFAKVTKVDGSAATGKITASVGATITGATTDRSFAFTSGSGNDIITVTGALTSDITSAGATVSNTIDLGAGDDTVSNSSGSIGVGASVNGGSGDDTIAASLVTVGNSARITNFEVLGLDKTSGAFDSDLLAAATGLEMLAQGATYNNVEQAQSLKIKSNIGTGTTTLSFTSTDVIGKADAYSITFGAEGGATTAAATTINAGTLVINSIENVTINSGSSKGFVNNTIKIQDDHLKALTLTGAAYKTTVSFNATTGTNTSSTNAAVKTIDGTVATGRLYIDTTNVVEDNVSGLTVTGGSAADQITLDSTVTGTVTANGGDGADTFILNGSMTATLTGGAGNDTFDLGAATVGVSNALGADSSLVYATITDFTSGDILKLDNISAGSSLMLSANAVSGVQNATSLTAALDAALKLSTAVDDATVYFNYGGNTYIAHEDNIEGLSINDVVVKLTGINVLSTAAVSSPATTGLFGEA